MKDLLLFALLLIASPAMAASGADCLDTAGCYDHSLIHIPPPPCAHGEEWTGTIVCDGRPTAIGPDAKVCGAGHFSCQPLSVQDTDSELAMVVFGYEGLLK